MKNRCGEAKIDLVNVAILTIMGSTVGTLLFGNFTLLPAWACLLLGIFVGTVGAAFLFGGGTCIVVFAVKKVARWRRR